MKLEVPDGLVSLLRVLEPSEGSVLESDVLRVLDGGLDSSSDVSIDEFGFLEELVDTSESDDCTERDEGEKVSSCEERAGKRKGRTPTDRIRCTGRSGRWFQDFERRWRRLRWRRRLLRQSVG